MYTRLAFSVGAHLDCEIMFVDEVLAVGDFAFQKKSLARMKQSMASGKTVVFVSHDTGAILQICTRCLCLDAGRLVADGDTSTVVEQYTRAGTDIHGERRWMRDSAPRFEDGSVCLRAIRLINFDGMITATVSVNEPFVVEVEFEVLQERHPLNVHLYFSHQTTGRLFVSMDNLDSPYQHGPAAPGYYRARCTVPEQLLSEGFFTIEYLICTNPTTTYRVTFPEAISFRVTDDRSSTGVRGNWQKDWPRSAVRPRLKWTFDIGT
jgi:lipopolysaccharide transport system ATP-binding protein